MISDASRQAWLDAANGLLAKTTPAEIFMEAWRRAADVAFPVLEACSELEEPYQHILPLLVAAEIVASLAVICGDNPVFLEVAHTLAQQRRVSGGLEQFAEGAAS